MNNDLDRLDQQFTKRVATVVLVSTFLILATIIGSYIFIPWFRTQGFQPVNGTIIRSEMKSCGEPGMYHETIRFSYTVEGQTYENGRLRIGPGPLPDGALICEGEKTIQTILDQYPVGATVDAWYDPDIPAVAIIDRSLGTMQKIFLAVFSGFGGIFLFIWYCGRGNKKKSNARQNENERAET